MKGLVERAHRTMILLLVLSLVSGVFSIEKEYLSPLQLGEVIYANCVSIKISKASMLIGGQAELPATKKFRKRVEDRGIGDVKLALRFVRVNEAVEIIDELEKLRQKVPLVFGDEELDRTLFDIAKERIVANNKYNLNAEEAANDPDWQAFMSAFEQRPRTDTFLEYLRKLRDIWRDHGSDEAMTFGELDEAASAGGPRILRLPFVDLKLSYSQTFYLLHFTSLFLLLYLLSVAHSLLILALKVPDERCVEWVFLHPSRLGPVIGIVWLCIPSLMCLSPLCSGKRPFLGSIVFALLLGAVAVLAIRKCLQTRRLVRQNADHEARVAVIGWPM